MKKTILLIALTLVSLHSEAQVGINTTSPNLTSILHIESNSQGVLFPRLTLDQMYAINTMAANNGNTVPGGLTVFCTDCCTNGTGGAMYYFDGAQWKSLDNNCNSRVLGGCMVVATVTQDKNIKPQDLHLLFDGHTTQATQPQENKLRLHKNGEDEIEFIFNQPLPPNSTAKIYWSDHDDPGKLGIEVECKDVNDNNSQTPINTYPVAVLPAGVTQTNVGNDYTLTVPLNNSVKVVIRAPEENDKHVNVYEFELFDENGIEITDYCN